jgi:hypothetical protein
MDHKEAYRPELEYQGASAAPEPLPHSPPVAQTDGISGVAPTQAYKGPAPSGSNYHDGAAGGRKRSTFLPFLLGLLLGVIVMAAALGGGLGASLAHCKSNHSYVLKTLILLNSPKSS